MIYSYLKGNKYLMSGWLLAMLYAVPGDAQVLNQDELLGHFDSFRQQAVQEKIYLHTDRCDYLAGEIIWFKLYNVDAFFHQQIDISKVAYIEVINQENKRVLQSKVAINDGYGNGSFELPVGLKAGNYTIKAYTRWMQNFSAVFFFEKSIRIANAADLKIVADTTMSHPYEMLFFPEGGNMVYGLSGKVGFKVINEYGNGIEATGVILNETGDTTARFSTQKFGLGHFEMTPVAGHTYHAAMLSPVSKSKLVATFPTPYQQGFAMQVNQSSDSITQVVVKSSPGHANGEIVYLFVHTRNAIKMLVKGALKNGTASFSVPLAKLGDGISHFTIFNYLRQPVCERLFFKYPDYGLDLNVSTDSLSYSKRGKVKINIQATIANQLAADCHLSMAVYRTDSLHQINDIDINSYLLLSSDLQGSIESPGYYFYSQDSETSTAMDNLMLTQGWRRFNWSDVLNNTKPAFKFIPELAGPVVAGQVVHASTALPAKNIDTYFGVVGKSPQVHADISGADGKVTFIVPDFNNNGEIILQAVAPKDSLYNVNIFSPFASSIAAKKYPPSIAIGNTGNELIRQFNWLQVQNAYNLRKYNTYKAGFASKPFYLKPDATYLLDSYVRFTTLEEVLREYVREVDVTASKDGLIISVIDMGRKVILDKNPLWLLDGIPVFDINKLMAYDPLKIQKLEVVASNYYYEKNLYNGIISLVTYKGNLEGYELDPKATVIDYEGLQRQREFYAPTYNSMDQLESRLPDYRTLLHWEPEIITGKDGKHRSSFFTSDIAGKYVVVLQGISPGGVSCSKILSFGVK